MTAECDIWSLGVLFFFMIHKKSPFNGFNTEDKINHMKSNNPIEYNTSVKIKLRELMNSMLSPNPSKRPDIYKILISYWVQNQLDKYGINSLDYLPYIDVKKKSKFSF